MPKPMRVEQANNRKLSDVYDFFSMTFVKPGEKQTPGHPIPAGAVNTLGEVPDSTWYTNRHTKRRMSIEELVRGPGNSNLLPKSRRGVSLQRRRKVSHPGSRSGMGKAGRTNEVRHSR